MEAGRYKSVQCALASKTLEHTMHMGITYTGCPGRFRIAQTAGVGKMVGSAINLGTQGGYTIVTQTPSLPPQEKFIF